MRRIVITSTLSSSGAALLVVGLVGASPLTLVAAVVLLGCGVIAGNWVAP